MIAGVDLALWDLYARRASLPLFRLLGGQQARLPVNASGINPDGPLAVVQRKHAEGYRSFKLKIGFSAQQDLDHLASLRAWLGPQADLMADVNQAWDLPQASAMLPRLEPLGLAWLEEREDVGRVWTGTAGCGCRRQLNLKVECQWYRSLETKCVGSVGAGSKQFAVGSLGFCCWVPQGGDTAAVCAALC